MKVINGHVNVLVDDDGTVKTARELVDSLVKAGRLVAELEQRLAAAESLNQKLIQFFITGMREIWEGHDWEGGEVQDLAEELGLIQRASDEDQDEEFGVFYDYSPEIKNLMDKANAPEVGDASI